MHYLSLMDLIKMGKLNNYIPKSIKNIRLINREIEDCIKKEYLNILNKNILLEKEWVVNYIKEINEQNIRTFIIMKLIKGRQIIINCNYKKINRGVFIKIKKDKVYLYINSKGLIHLKINNILEVNEDHAREFRFILTLSFPPEYAFIFTLEKKEEFEIQLYSV